MKVVKKELMDSLIAVLPGLASNEELEQTKSFIFTEGHIYTYNDEIAIYHPTNIDFVKGAIRADDFLAFLKTCKKTEVSIEMDDEAQQVTVKSARSKATFCVDSEIKVPLINTCENWKRVPDGLIPALKFCEVTVSTDDSLGVLTCVHVEGNAVQSSDNFRYTRHEMSEDCEDSLLIPNYAIKHLCGYNPIEYGCVKGWILFKNEKGAILACRTLTNNYPKVDKLRNVEGFDFEFPLTLGEELEKAAIFAKAEVGELPSVSIEVKKGKVIIKSENIASNFKSTIKIADTKINFKFLIAPKFMQDAIEIADTIIIGKRKIKLAGGDFEHIVTLLQTPSTTA